MAERPNVTRLSYWKDLTLTFADGSAATVSVDRNTYKAVVEDHDITVTNRLVQNYLQQNGGGSTGVPADVMSDSQSQMAVTSDSQIQMAVTSDSQSQMAVTSDSQSQKAVTSDSQSLMPVTTFSQSHMPVMSDSQSQMTHESQMPQSNTWNAQRTRALISMYHERKEKFNNGTIKKKNIWEEIKIEVNILANTDFTLSQIEGRWKTITAAYRKHKDDKNRTGKERKEFEYEDDLDHIFGNSHTINPAMVFSSSSTTSSDTPADDTQEEATAGNTCEARKGVKKQRKSQTGVGQMVDFMHTYVNKLEDREQQRIEESKQMHNEKMEIFKTLIDVLKKNKE